MSLSASWCPICHFLSDRSFYVYNFHTKTSRKPSTSFFMHIYTSATSGWCRWRSIRHRQLKHEEGGLTFWQVLEQTKGSTFASSCLKKLRCTNLDESFVLELEAKEPGGDFMEKYLKRQGVLLEANGQETHLIEREWFSDGHQREETCFCYPPYDPHFLV